MQITLLYELSQMDRTTESKGPNLWVRWNQAMSQVLTFGTESDTDSTIDASAESSADSATEAT